MYIFIFAKVIAGIVYFENHVIFINNNANNSVGGALYLLSFSQLYLMENTNLSFINNTGRYNNTHLVIP